MVDFRLSGNPASIACCRSCPRWSPIRINDVGARSCCGSPHATVRALNFPYDDADALLRPAWDMECKVDLLADDRIASFASVGWKTARCIRATLLLKIGYPRFRPLHGQIVTPTLVGVTCLAMQSGPIGDGDHEPADGSNAQRCAERSRYQPRFLCGSQRLVLAQRQSLTASLPALAADASFADKLPPIAVGTADRRGRQRVGDGDSRRRRNAGFASAEPIVTAALTDSSEMLRPETSPEPAAETSTATPEPGDANHAVGSTEVLDECLVVDTCVDRYLWALYQRTPKEDSVKEHEQRKVTVKKRGKLVTVTRTFTTHADEDFSWKDPKAAEHVGMPMADYVIGGMDRDFKLKLFHMLHAAEEAGLSPGITSAFRDDYRQSIASGLKAANDRSYHGGSFRGGYGHGLAADIVSVNGATRAQRLTSSETLWNWVDAHGKEFGIGRPYLDRDPPHVAPIDGKEYAYSPSRNESATGWIDSEAAQQVRFARRSQRGKTRANSEIVELTAL